jgi:NADH:ubiquinone oxidoreductase subunit E
MLAMNIEATKDILRGYGQAESAVLAALLEVQDCQQIIDELVLREG